MFHNSPTVISTKQFSILYTFIIILRYGSIPAVSFRPVSGILFFSCDLLLCVFRLLPDFIFIFIISSSF
jgi:hypothetical protein